MLNCTISHLSVTLGVGAGSFPFTHTLHASPPHSLRVGFGFGSGFGGQRAYTWALFSESGWVLVGLYIAISNVNDKIRLESYEKSSSVPPGVVLNVA